MACSPSISFWLEGEGGFSERAIAKCKIILDLCALCSFYDNYSSYQEFFPGLHRAPNTVLATWENTYDILLALLKNQKTKQQVEENAGLLVFLCVCFFVLFCSRYRVQRFILSLISGKQTKS